MQQIGQQQFLVLLFVLQAQLDALGQPFGIGVVVGLNISAGQQRQHLLVHRVPPGQHFGQRGARDEAALWPRMAFAHALVVAVEQHAIGRVVGPEAGHEGFEHEGLEEPGHMGQMPLHRAGVGHALCLAVGLAQRRSQRNGACPQREVTRSEIVHGPTVAASVNNPARALPARGPAPATPQKPPYRLAGQRRYGVPSGVFSPSKAFRKLR